MFETPSIYDEFECPGVWWHPLDESTTTTTGFLKRAFDTTDLLLCGQQKPMRVLEQAVEKEGKSKGTIWGRSSNNKDITLFDAFITNRMMNSGGVVESQCHVNSMLIGKHLLNREAAKFRKATFYYPGIEAWLNLAPFKHDLERMSNEGITIKFERLNAPEVLVESHSAKVKFTTLGHNDNRKDPPFFSIENRVFIEVEPNEEMPLDWFVTFEWQFSNLLQFLFASPVRCDHLQLCWNSDNANTKLEACSYFANLSTKQIPDVPKASRILFGFDSLSEYWGGIVNTYFRDAKILHNSFYLLSGDILNPPFGLENRFLALIQCLEGITRGYGDQTYVSAESYEKIHKALSSAIPAETDKSLKDKIKSMLKYGNEKSLRKRIKEIVSTIGVETQELVFKNQSSFIAGVVDTRNYWTHVLAEKTDSILEDNDLYCACEKLQTLLLILLAIRLGIPEVIVREKLVGTSMMAQKRTLYMQGRES